ncbi:Crp/Fnr family transcriptional regulator [Turneriella parva]|uniref:Transcriptional regulator, Crp/Fnr family n=1 Tax=Turneriella parva (strain ATCC BAA-1111 / DSM 21527 / NCTC 11395 / H) TaxID=869212 RepID=I4B1D2_TURPD|nr:Crp/Fnr family transcriptional regulator [Turneriella parva]AFM11089.1 putative transcriptional regulator, Crp/Fnr family [Turneriella parva DSM 21527]
MTGGGLFNKFGKQFNTGEIIFCEFEPGNSFYLIQTGRVKISKVVKDKEKTMDILSVGDIFGEMAILEEQPRSATATAIEPVTVLHFDRDNFVSMMMSQPQLAFKLLVVFSKRIYDAKRRLMILLLDDIQSKISDVFLMLAEKEPTYAHMREVSFPVTMDDVANWAGTSVDQVAEQLNHWAKVGKVELYSDRIFVRNLADFKRIVAQKRKTEKR